MHKPSPCGAECPQCVRKVVLFIIITLTKIIKHTMATVRNWIEERLLLIKQALQQPIVPNTPRDGIL